MQLRQLRRHNLCLDPLRGPSRAALTLPIDPESESVVQKLAAKVGLGSEREEIIEFTRAALAIEAERNDGMEFYASLM